MHDYEITDQSGRADDPDVATRLEAAMKAFGGSL